jgi:hypothetical protein
MKSRITIEINFDSNEPYIKVVESPSEDVRDKLLQFFRQKLQHTSSWFKFWFVSSYDGEPGLTYGIYPIKPCDLQKEGEAMLEQAGLNNTIPEQPSISH